MRLVRLIPFMFAAIAAGPALAQAPATPGESAKQVIGSWEFSNADRDKICTATFKADPSPVGFKVEFDANCANLFPLVRDVAGWKFPDNDLLYLLDAKGKSLAEFSEVEDGIYEAPTPGVGVLFLQAAAAAGPPPKPAAELAGDWTMRRGTAVLCVFTLSSTPSGDALALTVKPGCAASVAQINFTQWRLDRDELMLVPARGTPWRFEEGDNGAWQRVPENLSQFTLTRQ